MEQNGSEQIIRVHDLISRRPPDEKMILFLAGLFKEDATVPIARGLLQVLADEPSVRKTSRSGSTEEKGAEKGEGT